jgi:hypothetical protein
MSETPKTKKGRSARELAGGWSIILLASPFIVIAIGMSLLAVFLSVLFALNGTMPVSASILMLVLYGACAIAMLGLTFRIVRRSTFLAKRIYHIRQEQQRTATLPERDVQRLRLGEDNIANSADDLEEEKARSKSAE